MPILAYRPSVFEIGRDCFAHIGGQRKESFVPALAVHTQVTAIPVDVVQFQLDDLAARSPSRARMSNTARSRRPTTVVRSQLSIAHCACSDDIALGNCGVVDQPRRTARWRQVLRRSRRDIGRNEETSATRGHPLQRTRPHALGLASHERDDIAARTVLRFTGPFPKHPIRNCCPTSRSG